VRKDKTKTVKDATLLRGIKQGVGMVVKHPFAGGRNGAGRPNRHRFGALKRLSSGLCALTNVHLPLPRPIGGYTVCKTTSIISVGQTVTLFGAMKGIIEDSHKNSWLNYVAVGSNTSGLPVNSTHNTFFFVDSSLSASGFDDAQLVPAAITLQVMCGKPLQDAEGICYIGRCKQVLDLAGDTRSWGTLGEQLVAYTSPRICSAGKLALRGVYVNAIPYNMAEMADFTPRGLHTAGYKTWDETGTDPTTASFQGFAPLFIYNPNNIHLHCLLTIEWRTRFDPQNPAYAGHAFHPITSDSTWNSIIQGVEREGHGVKDIAAGVADFGEAVGEAAGAML